MALGKAEILISDVGILLRHIQSITGHRSFAALERYFGITEQQKENPIFTLFFYSVLI